MAVHGAAGRDFALNERRAGNENAWPRPPYDSIQLKRSRLD